LLQINAPESVLSTPRCKVSSTRVASASRQATERNAGTVGDGGKLGGRMHQFCAFVLWLLVGMVTCGCATITTGGFQTIGVKTDPEGADCRFFHDGNLVARVNPTPGPILVGKSFGNISALCRKDGYQDTAGTIGSAFQPMTFGNIILGGLVGIVIDATSGAMTKYPEAVTFLLVPHEFPGEMNRDQFFDDLVRSFLVEYEIVVGRIRASCLPESCARQLEVAEAGRTAKLAEIEQRRRLARIGGK
jgi:hypothetical protein